MVRQDTKQYLQNLALTNWDEFVRKTRIDLETIQICRDKERGLTLQQIANAFSMPKGTVYSRCLQCP